MRKIFLLLVCFIFVFAFSSASYGGQEMYMSGRLGISMPDDSDVNFDDGTSANFEFENGVAIAYAIGGAVNERMRIETEVGYQKNDLDKASVAGVGSGNVNGDSSSLSLLMNGYYDFVNDSPITPFFTMGLGLARVEVSNITDDAGGIITSDDDSVFAYQFGTGLSWAFADQMLLDFTYRYFATSDPNFEISTTEFQSNNFYIGFRTKF